ncbi:hypothetical protein HK405_006451, partial [Cladochytrium tenue]
AAFRAKELALRRFWQQESTVPVYIRRKGDGAVYGTALVLFTGAMLTSLNQITNFLIGGKK